MDLSRWPNLVAMFFEQASTKKNSPFLWKKQQGKWNSISWAETANQVRLLALALQEYGLNLGDRVVLVGENSASKVYVRNKIERTEKAGMRSIEHRLDADTDQATLLALIEEMNNDE